MKYIIGDFENMDALKEYIKGHPQEDVELEVLVSEYKLDMGNNLSITAKASEIEDLDKCINQSVKRSYIPENVRWYALVYAEVGSMMWDWQDLLPDV